MRTKDFLIISLSLFIGTDLCCNFPAWGGEIKPIRQGASHATKHKIFVKPTGNRALDLARTYMTAMSRPLAKTVLTERYRYKAEIHAASKLYARIVRTPDLEHGANQLSQEIEKVVVNNTLRQTLLSHVRNRQQSSLLYELEDYYHLAPDYISTFYAITEAEETFARSVLSYLHKHPHKPNWALRHLLRTEGIDPALKQEIRNVIKQNVISPDQTDHILQVLREMHQQYRQLLKDSPRDEEVAATVAIYKNVTEALEEFISVNDRHPEHQLNDAYERDLFNLISVLAYHHQANHFEQVIPYIKKMYEMLEKYPYPRFPEENTLRDLNKFINKHLMLPRGVHSRDILNPIAEEDMLYESMLYWRQNSPTFSREMEELPAYKRWVGPTPPCIYY